MTSQPFSCWGPSLGHTECLVSTAAHGGITHSSRTSRSVQHIVSYVALTAALRKQMKTPSIFTIKIIFQEYVMFILS